LPLLYPRGASQQQWPVHLNQRTRGIRLGRNGADRLAPAYRAEAVERASKQHHSITSLVMASTVGGYFEVQRLRDLEVDDKLEFCWQLYREIGGFVTFEDLIDIRACATEKRDTARPIVAAGGTVCQPCSTTQASPRSEGTMSEASQVRLERQGDVAVVVIDNPPVNALGPGVREGIIAAVKQANADPEIRATVAAGRRPRLHRRCRYPAIRQAARSPAAGPDDPRLLDGSAKPVMAAIHGYALGGGLEVALACHLPDRRRERQGRAARSADRYRAGRWRHAAPCRDSSAPRPRST